MGKYAGRQAGYQLIGGVCVCVCVIAANSPSGSRSAESLRCSSTSVCLSVRDKTIGSPLAFLLCLSRHLLHNSSLLHLLRKVETVLYVRAVVTMYVDGQPFMGQKDRQTDSKVLLTWTGTPVVNDTPKTFPHFPPPNIGRAFVEGPLSKRLPSSVLCLILQIPSSSSPPSPQVPTYFPRCPWTDQPRAWTDQVKYLDSHARTARICSCVESTHAHLLHHTACLLIHNPVPFLAFVPDICCASTLDFVPDLLPQIYHTLILPYLCFLFISSPQRPRPFTVWCCRRKYITQQSIPIPTPATPCRDYKTISYNHNKQHRQHPSNRSKSTIGVDSSRKSTFFFDDQHSSPSSAQSLTQRRCYDTAGIDRSQPFRR